mgnify:CR=1 FL=1
MNIVDVIIRLAILLFSVIIHEVMHGLVAERLGDDTAREEGRITLNPIPHIDPFGSILLPFLLMTVGSPIIFGAAKPVPVDFSRLKPRRWGMTLVSLAGPLSNLGLAILFIIPLKLGLTNAISGPILVQAAIINLVLAVFNSLPIPPLDGSKVVASLLPEQAMETILSWERYGFILIFALLYIGVLDRVLNPILTLFFRVINL